MSLYKCPECGRYYQHPESFNCAMVEGVEHNLIYSAVIQCSCGFKSVSGGEDAEDGILCFSAEYNRNYATLPVFNAVMLIECDSSDEEQTASTYVNRSILDSGKIIYLKPEKKLD